MKTHALGGEVADLGSSDISRFVAEVLGDFCEGRARPSRALLVPPDQTRRHSRAGDISRELAAILGPALRAVIPATGTHRAMGRAEIEAMFPGMDPGLFLSHDHRGGTLKLGEIEASFVEALSGGRLSFPFPGTFNRDLVEGGWDLVVSVGQVVPHEVVGMANYTKNLVVGLGGAEAIDLSHWLGAVTGLESIMGRADTPVRRLLDESARRFLSDLPIVYILTVVGPREDGSLALRGLFAGSGPSAQAGSPGDGEAFNLASALAAKVNVKRLGEAVDTCVVSLAPEEFRSTWLGNKAIYRTRMALSDGAELFILAPGVDRFGEDTCIDALIRRHGYHGTEATLEAVAADPELAANLAAAAHLVHGSSEGRFRITYCTKPSFRGDIEAVGYSWMDLREALSLFSPDNLHDGWDGTGGKRLFYVSNPALGLWKRPEM
jgi:nickel-dependent lactate racemase